MSFPWTMRLSLDRFRSSVSISNQCSQSASGDEGMRILRTMTSQLQVEHIANFDIHHSQEALILSLELALVEDLNRYDR